MKNKQGNVAVIAIIVVIVAITAGVVGWMFAKKSQAPTSQTVATQPTTPETQTQPTVPAQQTMPTDESATWKKFDSKLLNLSFSYPLKSEFQEEDVFADRQIKYTGKDVYFSDKNDYSPALEAITKDFSATDSIPHDEIKGSLDSENSIKVVIFDDKYTKVIKKGTGIYQVIGYGNIECSPVVQSMLLVAPPANSNLKYISFYLGNANNFTDSELQEVCSPKETAIQNKVNSILNGQVSEISNKLDLAVRIANTIR